MAQEGGMCRSVQLLRLLKPLCLLNYRLIYLLFLLITFYFQCYKTILIYFYFTIQFLHVCHTCMITSIFNDGAKEQSILLNIIFSLSTSFTSLMQA
jgi:hypothetical protein